jgi:hypothetical protein
MEGLKISRRVDSEKTGGGEFDLRPGFRWRTWWKPGIEMSDDVANSSPKSPRSGPDGLELPEGANLKIGGGDSDLGPGFTARA